MKTTLNKENRIMNNEVFTSQFIIPCSVFDVQINFYLVNLYLPDPTFSTTQPSFASTT